MNNDSKNKLHKVIFDHLSNIYPNIKDEELNFSDIEINDYSFCLQLTFNSEHLFIKIPKRNQAYQSPNKRNIFPLTTQDKNFAKEEFASLESLYLHSKEHDEVGIIQPVLYIEEINAIVSKKFKGVDFFVDLRAFPFLSRLKKTDLHRKLKSLSKFISSICLKNITNKKQYDYDDRIKKISKYLDEVGKIALLREEEIFYKEIFSIESNKEVLFTNGYKGFDIRNILEDANGNLCILDPGKVKKESQEAFIARFYATLLILYWGSPFFIFRFTPHKSLLNSFEEYMKASLNIDDVVFAFELRKELIKHWCLALRALNLKKWPTFFKAIVQKIYIDNFYQNILINNKKNLKTLID